jgi:plasmid stabilization system protein ParE
MVRPEAEADVVEAAAWYNTRSEGLGAEFVQEILAVLDALALNPLLSRRRHPRKNIRWRYTERFPYRVIYELCEQDESVVVAAVLHAARHDRHWRDRLSAGR